MGFYTMSLVNLQTLQEKSTTLAAELGLVVKTLSDKELYRFGRAFERQFLKEFAPRDMVDIHIRHMGEYLMGAMVAKEQMDSEIDGEQPMSAKICGPIPIRACYLLVGDDWEDVWGIYAGVQGAWSTGAPQNWIHNGTTLAGGAGNLPIRIGTNAVHVVTGLASAHASPKIESVAFWIDGKPKSVLLPFRAQKDVPYTIHIKELDNAYILKKGTTIMGNIFISSAFGAPSGFQTDYPYLWGVSYIAEPQARVHDPVTLVGTAASRTANDIAFP